MAKLTSRYPFETNCDVVTKGYLDVNLAIIGPQTLRMRTLCTVMYMPRVRFLSPVILLNCIY